jgi:hypothetical protein
MRYRLTGTHALRMDKTAIQSVCNEIGPHGIGSGLRQTLIDGRRTYSVCMTDYRDIGYAFMGLDLLDCFVEISFPRRQHGIQTRLIECKQSITLQAVFTAP